MGKREQRQDAIKDILRTEKVRTQHELADLLRERGFDCIQSTVSRDIAEMGLVKASDKCYSLPSDVRLKRMLTDMVTDVKAAENLVVIRTVDGAAAGIAGALDKAGLAGILGTVAGDDTIFVAAENADIALDLKQQISLYRA